MKTTPKSELKEKLRQAWDKLNGWQRALLLKRWKIWRRENQTAPDGDFLVWLILGGRGAGKTRAGAEWIRERVKSGARHIALVAANFREARAVMLDGQSGLLNIGHPSERPKYIASRHRLEWPNGAVGHVFSAEAPDGLRGSQFDAAWADEFCAWNHAEDTLSNLRLALRLDGEDGQGPQLVVTTTPRSTPELVELKETKGVVTHTLRTAENVHNLAQGYYAAMEAEYGGSPLGMQELEGKIVTEWPGALWSRATIAKTRENTAPELDRIVIALDPPATSGPKSDACGIVVAGVKDGRAYVLQDCLKAITPTASLRKGTKAAKWSRPCCAKKRPLCPCAASPHGAVKSPGPNRSAISTPAASSPMSAALTR